MKWLMIGICTTIAFIIITDFFTSDCWKQARKELISYATEDK